MENGFMGKLTEVLGNFATKVISLHHGNQECFCFLNPSYHYRSVWDLVLSDGI